MRDYIGMWFQARRELGIDDTMLLGVLSGDGRSRHDVPVPHAETDALGIWPELLGGWRASFRVPADGRSRELKAPSLTTLIRQRAWSRVDGRTPAVWQHFTDDDQALCSDYGVSVCALTEMQTLALRSHARAQGIGLNALVLSVQHRLVSETLCVEPQAGSWFLPVNLRGAVQLPRERMNQSSGVWLDLAGSAGAEDIHNAVRAALSRGQHWWLWRQARIGRYIGQAGVNWLYRRLVARQRVFGSFSALGDWVVDWRDSDHPCDSVLFACGPGSPSYPVACGAMCTNGRLTLSLKFDPSLGIGRRRREQHLQRWREGLLALTGNPDVTVEERGMTCDSRAANFA